MNSRKINLRKVKPNHMDESLSISDRSMDIDDSYRNHIPQIIPTEISFYGSNAEMSVVHTSYMSQTMNEEGKMMVNQYELINSIGRGSFGKVVKAYNTKDKTLYVSELG